MNWTSTLAPPPSVSMNPVIANVETVAELLERLGGIPASRVRWKPYPGTATEKDAIAAVDGPGKCLCELVDGILVEKAVGQYEARVGGLIFHFIEDYLEEHNLGIAYPADAMLRVVPSRVRLPDVSFVSWSKLPKRRLPTTPIVNLAPDLAVEVLSKGNTLREMKAKREEYFKGGTRLVWEINPKKQSARAYTGPTHFQEVGPDGALDGGDVLPGFALPLKRLFARAHGA